MRILRNLAIAGNELGKLVVNGIGHGHSLVVDFYKTGVLLRGGDTTNDVKRDAARGASVLIQIELALAKRVICLVTIIADSAQHQAIDTILGRKNLVKVSSTPGKTSNINFFEADDVHFVDLPGYGFARRPKAERDRWAELIGDFFDSERSFNLVVSLVDIRHDPSKLDHDMIDYLQGNEFNFIVCLTKADKLSRTQQARQAAAIKKQLNVPAENVIITSSQLRHSH